MKRKTYNNVIKASRLIMKKGYNKQESLDMAVKIFDMMEEMKNNGNMTDTIHLFMNMSTDVIGILLPILGMVIQKQWQTNTIMNRIELMK